MLLPDSSFVTMPQMLLEGQRSCPILEAVSTWQMLLLYPPKPKTVV